MGVIYKILPQIKDFIIAEKKKDPNLSCRKASVLIFKKFKLELSKSSINSIIKQASLSGPVGRRSKPRRKIREAEGLGTYLLKAVDLILGGSASIFEVIKKRLPEREDIHLLEALIYLPLFTPSRNNQEIPANCGLWSLLGKKYPLPDILSYLADLQAVKILAFDIFKEISRIFKDVWFIKITFSDNSLLYLDGEMRTLWSTPNIPYDFSSTIYKIRSYIKNYLQENLPLVLFTAPGYDTPTNEFIDFLLVQEVSQKKMTKITLYGNKMEELESIGFPEYAKKYYIFGLWPWQFERYRKIKINSEFIPFLFEPLQEQFYLADVEVELSQPKTNQRVTLRGCALKNNLEGKIKLIIAANIPQAKLSSEEMVSSYLEHWPEPEKSFTDYSHKIELFTYTASSRKVFSIENLALKVSGSQNITEVLDYYLQCLDLYLRWHILPFEYEELDFSTTKQRLYSLKAKSKVKKDEQIVSFILPSDYAYLKDLAYACERLNEKNILLPEQKQVWFNLR